MKKKIINSLKSGVGSYVLLILLNYIIYKISGWTITQEMLPSFSKDFAIVSIFLFLLLFISDYFFYKGKY
ncbi:MAG: hypothetical protein ACJZZG_03090 [Cytophagales bacterium]|nr:hypothetical protein [Flammeovirgaceae bacterium]|tara:strand:- start:197 stop:406 length:210 start_codon:yes stop_codon:yes gene_type:complete